jgi:hypothetical protein
MLSLLAAGAVLIRPLGPHPGAFPSAFNNPLFRLLSHPWFWAALGVIAGPCLFFRGLQILRLQRLVADTPRSTVRSAAIGNVELAGTACGPYVLAAPLSKKDCFYYRLIVWVRRDNQSKRFVEERFAPLFLDDGTGQVLIDPRRARLNFDSTTGGPGDSFGHLIERHGYSAEDVERVREFCIPPGTRLFAFGTLRENPCLKDDRTTPDRAGPYVSADEADRQRREVFPMLDSTMLDSTIPSGTVLAGAENFDVCPPVVLMKGAAPFVLSSRSYRDYVAGLRWKSSALIAGGGIWFAAGVWQVVSRLR